MTQPLEASMEVLDGVVKRAPRDAATEGRFLASHIAAKKVVNAFTAYAAELQALQAVLAVRPSGVQCR